MAFRRSSSVNYGYASRASRYEKRYDLSPLLLSVRLAGIEGRSIIVFGAIPFPGRLWIAAMGLCNLQPSIAKLSKALRFGRAPNLRRRRWGKEGTRSHVRALSEVM